MNTDTHEKIAELKTAYINGDSPEQETLFSLYGGLTGTVMLEQGLYGLADKKLKGYAHGSWTFEEYQTPRGYSFLVWIPPHKESGQMTLEAEGHMTEVELSPRAAGWAMTALVVNHLGWYLSDKGLDREARQLSDQWEYLNQNYWDVLDDADARAVWTFLD